MAKLNLRPLDRRSHGRGNMDVYDVLAIPTFCHALQTRKRRANNHQPLAAVPGYQSTKWRNPMSSLRTALIASVMTLAFGAPAFAQNIMMEIADRGGIIVDSHGKVERFSGSERAQAMMKKYGHPVKAGTIFYMSGGTLYMAQDRRMAGGVSLREALVRSF
jgi:hypothetical protein